MNYSSFRAILIWLYPEKPSKEEKIAYEEAMSIMILGIGSDNSYLECALFRSQK